MTFQPIENYGVIGNMCSAALVGIDASIDFFCFPRFDSPTVFAALLHPDTGGSFTVKTGMEDMETKQLYAAETNVLLTRFLSLAALAELTDFMPVTANAQKNQLVRVLRAIHGSVTVRVRCQPNFNYARDTHTIELGGNRAIFRPGDPVCCPMQLQASVPLTIANDAAVAEFTLEQGQSAMFVLSEYTGSGEAALDCAAVEGDLKDTLQYWREWSSKSQYRGRWREAVNRSALVLKLLTSREHGSLIAAVTFGLPETIGGSRNWDYRYTWLRDAAFTLYAFMRLGFRGEADHFWTWLAKRIAENAGKNMPMQIMYRLDGGTEIDEAELDHLRGYKDSKPILIGNAAHDQQQLDIYGELFDALYLYSKYGHAIAHDGWTNVKETLAWLGKNWHNSDEGIWEMRANPKHLLHSRLMCWVAFDRAIRLAHKRSLSAPLQEWYRHRDAIVDDIYEHFWNEELQSFVQAKGSKALDASTLLMPLMRFISPVDPKWLSTMKAIEEHLSEGGFVFRYRNSDAQDGLDGEEGSFTCCSFWLVECLARADQVEKARLHFETLLAHGNHLGLFSEQMCRNGRQLGNYPQALTHLALISAATYLDRALSKADPKEWSN